MKGTVGSLPPIKPISFHVGFYFKTLCAAKINYTHSSSLSLPY